MQQQKMYLDRILKINKRIMKKGRKLKSPFLQSVPPSSENVGGRLFPKYFFLFFSQYFAQVSLKKIQAVLANFSANFHLCEAKLYWNTKSQQSSGQNSGT